MRISFRSSFWLCILVTLFHFNSFAQPPGPGCPNVIDQNQLASNTGSQGVDQWQIFRAGITGKLSRIDIYTNTCPSAIVTLNVYAGQGIGGALLSSTTYTMTSWCNAVFPMDIPILSAPNVTSGADYTFRIQTSANILDIAHNGNPYPFGHYFSDAYGLQTNWDLKFTTYVQQTTYPTATITPGGPTSFCTGGSVPLNANVGSFTYQWWQDASSIGGATSSTYNATSSGVHAAVITSTVTNCWNLSNQISVTAFPLPSANSGGDVSVCTGTPASFTITPSGGTPSYVYEWFNVPTGGAPFSTTQVYSSSPAPGTYTYYGVVKDANNCVSPRDPVQLTVNQMPTMVSVNKTDIVCFGNNNGTLTGNASGGTSPYEFSFTGSPPFLPNPITGLSAGSYTLYARDVNGCVSSNWMMNSIMEPPLLTLSSSSTSVSCFGGSDGSATMTASGGTGGYTYSWSPIGGTAATATGLPAGTYTCNVLDANACSASLIVTVSQPPALNLTSAASTNVSCFGGTNGTASVNAATGGASGYTYNWTPGNPTGDGTTAVTGLTAGNWTCTVTDVNGCTAQQTFTITQPSILNLTTASSTNVSCFGGTNGNASVNVATGGASGYTYNWTPGNPTGDGTTSVTGLTAGNWTCTVTDVNGCTALQTFSITQPAALILSTSTSTNVSCFGGSNGTASVNNAAGGTPGYTYNWTPGNPTGDGTTSVTGLTAGNWTCTVTDANSCTSLATFSITQPAALIASSVGQTNVTCSSGSNGSATVSAAGGAGGYSYSWTPVGGVAATATGLIAGNYTCTVTDANGCTAIQTYTISQPTPVNISANSQTNILCNGAATGAISVNPATGGSGIGYQYSINGGAYAAATSFTGLSAGTYTVVARDNNLCPSNSVTFTVTQSSPITLGTSGNSAPCSGTAISVTLTGSGGAGGYSYSWIATADNPNTTGENFSTPSNTSLINNIITNLTTAAEVVNYSVNVTDANACVANFNIPTTIAPAPTLAIIGNQIHCAGSNNTAIAFSPSIGGSTINWTNSDVSIGISGSGIGNISAVPLINAGTTPVVANFSASANFSGCTGPSQSFNITVNPSPVVTSANSATVCEGIALNLPLTSNIGGTTFSWVASNNPNTSGESTGPVGTSTINNTITSTSTVNELVVYSVTPTSSGCVGGVQTVNVTVKPQPNLSAITNQTLCASFLTSAISFTSDVGGSTFSWTNSNTSIGIAASGTANIPATATTNAGASPIVGNFSAQATANGCISTPQVFSITVNPIPTTPVPTASSACLGSSTSFTTPLFAGGTYNWNFGDGNTTTTQNPNHTYVAAGVYTASVTVTAATCVSAVGTVNATVNPTSVGGTITGGTTPACNGANSGTLTLVGNTGTVNGWEFSINGGGSWSPIANTTTSQVYSNLTVTTMYRAIVQSGVCSAVNSTTRTIVINDPPSASNAGIDQSLCNQTTATLSANVPGVGTGSWSVISGTAVVTSPTSASSGVTGLTIGASSVLRWTIANSPCTSTTDDITIFSNSSPSILGTLSACVGSTSALSGTGTPHGTTPWTSSAPPIASVSSVGLVTGNIAGTINITYMDINSCSTTSTFTVNALPTASITAGGPTTFCSGGSVLLSASVGAYTYQWMHGVTPIAGETSSTYNAINAGNHTVVITDIGTGCQATSNMININIDALPTGTAMPVDASCSGLPNGSVSVTPSGTGPFTYSYNGSAFVATASQTGLSSGNYTVNVQSGAGCVSANILYTINEPTMVTSSIISSTDPTCFGTNDGSAAISAFGGNGIYTYSLNGAAFVPSNTFAGLSAGSYTIDVQDGNGCLGISSPTFTLIDPILLSVGTTTTNVNCFGGNDGTITASGNGGTGGYQYSIDNITFQGSTIFSGLSAGSYTVYITDASGCTSGSTTFISQPASNFLITTLGLDYVCDGEALAETFSSSGGFGSITYSWAAQPNPNGATSGSGNTISETLSTITTDPNIPETVIYDLSAIDQNGCSATSTFTAYVHPLPPVNITSDVNPLCVSSVATLAATYIGDFIGWNPTTGLTVINNDTATFTPPASGNFVVTYTVAMNTGANCTNSGAITLTVTPAPTAPTLAVNSPVCAGSPVNLTANTIASATYSWSGPNGFTSALEDPTIPIALPADAGTYTCTVDVAGCISSSTVNVAVNPKPQAIILGVSTTFCANETFTLDGSNSLHNSSAITNFQWQLNGVDIPGANAFSYIGNTPGAYKLVVTNDLGCMDTTITPNIANADPIPTPVINGANGFCFGGNVTLDGTASSAGGASVIDNYEWLLNGTSVSSGPTSDSYLATIGGDYQLIVLNSNGCKDTTALFTVTEHAIPSVVIDAFTSTVCINTPVALAVQSPNGTSAYTWNLSGAVPSTSTSLNPSVTYATAGTYTLNLSVVDINSCTNTAIPAIITVNPAPTAIASFTSNDTICYNGNASVALNLITGGTYSWNSSIGLSSASQTVTFNNITTSGNVQFYGTVTDAAGCASANDTLNLFVQNQPTVPVISNASSVCPGQAFTLNVSPVIPGANYFWTDPAATTQNAIDLTSITIPVATAITAGPYVVYYIDPLGCTSTTSALYNQPLDPTPIVSINGVSTICSGNSTMLSASTSVGAASAYQWYNNGTAIAGATSASYNVSTPGNYNVIITLTTGCMDSAAVGTTVNVSSGPIVTVNPLTSSVCAGNSATINASGAVTYSWDTGATTASITVNPTATTSYIVTGTDASGCTNKDTAVVIVNSLPATPVITPGSTTECAGTNVFLGSSSAVGNIWINTSTLAVIGTAQNISHTETVAGVYNYGVYVTDANSCNSLTANITVTFNSCLTNLISDNASTNANTPVSGNFLTNDGNPSGFISASIISGPLNGTMSASSNGSFTYTPNTNYSGYDVVIVQVCNATPTCLNDTIYIVVNPNIIGDTYTVNGLSTPNTIIGNVLSNDAGSGISGNVTLVNSVTNGIIVIDSLGNFNYTPNAGFCGTDIFTYNVCDQNGLCANAGVNLIVTCDSTVTTTTGFSPNGDGVNDNWVIQGIETTQNTVTVFDRWGNQVISFTNYNNTNTAWDGKNSNGVELPAGTYFYSIDIPNEKSRKGWVEITK